MIEDILREAAVASFDFRQFANPTDPLVELFDEWVDYYRLKFAIAKVVQPKSILEIGVRFGYSARSFLEASPSAKFVGIDLDCDRFGGEPGALNWAQKILHGYNARFIVANSQKMQRFPEGSYDLVHVDGQQDGIGTFHDLRRAVAQAKWVLLDGYFWTRENFLNANDFLLKFKDVISYAFVIPGYAGDLLIRVRDTPSCSVPIVPISDANDSGNIRQFYDKAYYLKDCGGFQTFRRSEGKIIDDVRYVAMLELARLTRLRRALDLGCGRGEIAYQLALRGCEVTAVDYSSAAIELAKSCLEGETKELKDRITYLCADAATLSLEQRYDIALAGDLIEHLSPHEVTSLFANVASHLERDGLFIIHTYPNLWFYKYHHPRLRAAAAKLGAFVPAEPRTRYELLMHINEQSPAGLRRQLSHAFAYVRVWLGRPDSPGEGLVQKLNRTEVIAAPDIYAVASHSPIDVEAARRLFTQPVLADYVEKELSLHIAPWPQQLTIGQRYNLVVRITNKSAARISSLPPWPVNVSYHWCECPGGSIVMFEGLRTRLPRAIEPGETLDVHATIRSPESPGEYQLSMTLVQEGCRWFDTAVVATCIVTISRGS